MELEATWGRATRVWFAYLWRNLIALVGGMIAGGLVGLLVGVLGTAWGVPHETGQKLTILLSAVLGLAVSIVPIRLILGKDFGEFRLVLLSNERATGSASPETRI